MPFLTLESSRDPFLSLASTSDVLPSDCSDVGSFSEASSPLLCFFPVLESASEDETSSPSFEETATSFFHADDFSFGGAMTF